VSQSLVCQSENIDYTSVNIYDVTLEAWISYIIPSCFMCCNNQSQLTTIRRPQSTKVNQYINQLSSSTFWPPNGDQSLWFYRKS